MRPENLRIASHLPKEGLTNGLRFNIGKKVQANSCSYVNGQIIKLWDAGCVYCNELEDEERKNVWAPQEKDYIFQDEDP